MDHQHLYKKGKQLNDKNARISKIRAERSTKRKNVFAAGRRMIEESCALEDNEENIPLSAAANDCVINKSVKKSKAEYIQKFLEWKAEKEKRLLLEKQQRKPPFIPAVAKSFAPTNHTFQPPTNVKCLPLDQNNQNNIGLKTIQHNDGVRFRKPLTLVSNQNANEMLPSAKFTKPNNGAIPKMRLASEMNGRGNAKAPRTTQDKKIRKPQINLPKNTDKFETPAKIDNDNFNIVDNTLKRSFLTSTTQKSKSSDDDFFNEVSKIKISPIDPNDPLSNINLPKNSTKKSKSASKHFSSSKEQKNENIIENETNKNYKTESNSLPCTITSENQESALNHKPQNENNLQLSPLVTTCGNGTAKKEQERRESLYKLEISLSNVCKEVPKAHDAIKYFRQILGDEEERLQDQCNFWDEYQTKNREKIEENGCDMINATIGQTKLLLTSKFKQFRGLIDRCEDDSQKNNSEKAAQNVLPDDLEGFWTMVNLQIKNVDMRFENLNKWKNNNWETPEIEKAKRKKKRSLTGISKSKIKKNKFTKPNSNIVEFLKKVSEEYKKNNGNNIDQNQDIIFVGPRKLHNESASKTTSNRRSIRLENRKSLSSHTSSILNQNDDTILSSKKISKSNAKTAIAETAVNINRSVERKKMKKSTDFHENAAKSKDNFVLHTRSNFVTSTAQKFSSSGDFCEEECKISRIESTENFSNNTKLNKNSTKRKSAQKSLSLSKEIIQGEDVDLNQTPENQVNLPLNYLSPFVTTSRGKGNAKKEQEIRESLYKLEISSPPTVPIVIRRVLESIKYFRKILNDETKRLQDQCELWNKYRNKNQNILEENGDDMINAAIGQTKLLLTSKFKQFHELIDRCEHNCRENKPEKSAQKILPDDLEGFWSMVKLQITNVEERFENLEKCRANNWQDTEIETKKITKKHVLSGATKPLKSKKIKHNGGILEFLKKVHMDYKKKNQTNTDQQNRDVIFVKPRKFMNLSNVDITPNRRSNKKASPMNVTPQGRKDINLHISVLRNTLERKSLNKKLDRSPNRIAQKSILKTPGTKTKDKRVLFNEKLDYKSPDLNTLSGIEMLSDDDNCNQNRRSLCLRSRRVLMRPDSEIPIPI